MARFIVDVANLPQEKVKMISETIANAINGTLSGVVVSVEPIDLDNTNQFMEDTFFTNKTQVEQVDEHILEDICNLQIFKDDKQIFYKVLDLTNSCVTLVNISDDEDEYYLDILYDDNDNYYLDLDEIGFAINLEDFYSDLETAFENQEVEDEKTFKRCSN